WTGARGRRRSQSGNEQEDACAKTFSRRVDLQRDISGAAARSGASLPRRPQAACLEDRVAARFSRGQRLHACMQALDRKDPERDEAGGRVLSKCPGARQPCVESNRDVLLLEHVFSRKPICTFGPTLQVRSKALILRLESRRANRLPADRVSLSP